MSALYLAADPLEAEILKDYLAAHGIAVRIFGALGWAGRGELQADPYPRLLLENPADAVRARELLASYEHARHAHGQWRCACGEASPVTFEVCWNCQEPRPAANQPPRSTLL